jgi:hypothetical protein
MEEEGVKDVVRLVFAETKPKGRGWVWGEEFVRWIAVRHIVAVSPFSRGELSGSYLLLDVANTHSLCPHYSKEQSEALVRKIWGDDAL